MKDENKKEDKIIIHLIGGKKISFDFNFERLIKNIEEYSSLKFVLIKYKYIVFLRNILYIEKKELK